MTVGQGWNERQRGRKAERDASSRSIPLGVILTLFFSLLPESSLCHLFIIHLYILQYLKQLIGYRYFFFFCLSFYLRPPKRNEPPLPWLPPNERPEVEGCVPTERLGLKVLLGISTLLSADELPDERAPPKRLVPPLL